ncbi:MAG: phosphoribosylamine--glycine ligase [Vagococcus sp.]|uniref:phosphoribosylamine--glycine ligase n=1 Tax=Vagococcus sp. TaxID=1933889 RepID=UPI002FC97745
MNRHVLVIGNGGREHAICKKLLESPLVKKVYCAKGNPGMLQDNITLVDIEYSDHNEIILFCQTHQIDWVLVGPEQPLINGLIDDLMHAGIKAFGPTKKAAQIEGSKEFAKKLMSKYNIPTASYQSFSDYSSAIDYVKNQNFPLVIKADGLAAGKGVQIVNSQGEAKACLTDFLVKNQFCSHKPKVIIEEFLIGKEFSLLSFVNSTGIYPMVSAKDYKAIYNGDEGPNTGGMGAYSPVSYVTPEIEKIVIDTIITPTVEGLKVEGLPFEGVLYTGLILTNDGPKVIEYNTRFGDPETQVILNRLESDFYKVVEALINQEIPQISWKNKGVSLGVVVAAKGYPGKYEKGVLLPKFKKEEEVSLYFSGVKKEKGNLISDGGRVFLAEVEGRSHEEANKKMYHWLKSNELEQFYYRKDIGK